MKCIFFVITLLGAMCGAGLLIAYTHLECERLSLSLYTGRGCDLTYISNRCNITINSCYGVAPWNIQIYVYKGTCDQDCPVDTNLYKTLGIWLVSVFGILFLGIGVAWMLTPRTIIVPMMDVHVAQPPQLQPQLQPKIRQSAPSHECPICFDDTGKSWVCIVGCRCKDQSPAMHKACLATWAETSSTCPFCRDQL